MSNVTEALKIWDALKPMIDKEIEAKTRSCVRAKKMVVKTPPNGSTIGVIEPYEANAINVPYSSAVKDAQAGESVWVQWFFGNASTMMAIAYGDGDMPYAVASETSAALAALNSPDFVLVLDISSSGYRTNENLYTFSDNGFVRLYGGTNGQSAGLYSANHTASGTSFEFTVPAECLSFIPVRKDMQMYASGGAYCVSSFYKYV